MYFEIYILIKFQSQRWPFSRDSYVVFVTVFTFLFSCAYVSCLLLPLCFSFHLLISNIHKICSYKVNVDSFLLDDLIIGLFLTSFYITKKKDFDCNEISMLVVLKFPCNGTVLLLSFLTPCSMCTFLVSTSDNLTFISCSYIWSQENNY